jgi:multiple sugar transport system permease protein
MKQKTFELSLERGDLLPLLMMLPTLLLIFCMMAAPLFYGFFLSFFNDRFGAADYAESFAGLANYVRFFKDPAAHKAVFNTLYFSFGAIAGDFVLGTVFAVFLAKIPRLLASVLRPIVTIPLLVSPVVVGLIWRYIYDPYGILYWFLGIFGLGMAQFPGVTAASTSMLSVIIAHWWQVTPFIIIVLTAGLLSIPEEYYEAAKIDGAGALAMFFRITLPQLKKEMIVRISMRRWAHQTLWVCAARKGLYASPFGDGRIPAPQAQGPGYTLQFLSSAFSGASGISAPIPCALPGWSLGQSPKLRKPKRIAFWFPLRGRRKNRRGGRGVIDYRCALKRSALYCGILGASSGLRSRVSMVLINRFSSRRE